MRRDDPDVFEPAGRAPLPASPPVVIEALARVVTKARFERLEAIAARRMRSVVPVLDDLTDPHNTSAVLRSAEAFGIQEIHVVTGRRPFMAAHRVTRGCERWLEIVRHANADACGTALRERGFQIVVAAADGRLAPADLRAMPRVAVVFGNEHRGASESLRELADATYAIPMVGFVESLNVSVAAAVTLFGAADGRQGELNDAERQEVLARFLMQSVRDAERIVAEFRRDT